MGKLPHGRDLRLGRYSQAEQIYLLTLVTRNRSAVFGNFPAARQVVLAMHDRSVASTAETLAFVVMPDHVHWLLRLLGTVSLGEAVRRLKAKVSLALRHSLWQHGFHDHALRRDEDLAGVARYIVANPVRAGLVRRVGDYPHWDAVWLD